jgi:cell division protein FtsB
MAPDFEQILKRHKNRLMAGALTLTVCWAAYSGKRGVDELLAKRSEIRQLQEENQRLEHENHERKDRIDRMRNSVGQPDGEMDLEIHRQNLAKPGETIFMLPENERGTDSKKPKSNKK